MGVVGALAFALLPVSCFVTTDENLWRDSGSITDGTHLRSAEGSVPGSDFMSANRGDGAPPPPDPDLGPVPAADAAPAHDTTPSAPDAAPLSTDGPPPPTCTAFSAQPLKTGQDLFGMWASSAEVWVVGENGSTWRSKGAGWSSIPAPTTKELRGIWGSSPSSVWAVGKGGTVLHFDGTKWTSVPSGLGVSQHLYAVWGSSAKNVWAVGKGVIIHFNGQSWNGVASVSDTLYGVWGSSPNDVWAVGAGGMIVHYNGVKWSIVKSPSNRALRAVWGSSAQDVWAVGDHDDDDDDDPLVLHFNSVAWKHVKPGVEGNLLALWVSSGGQVWAAGYNDLGKGQLLHHDGSKWHDRSPGGDTLWAVSGASGKVWAVGESGTAWACP
jgi:hypothetical protein